jgi:putative FmdB family regulatory protein
MPIYEYKCPYCGHIFEVRRTKIVNDRTVESCPKCKNVCRPKHLVLQSYDIRINLHDRKELYK